MISSLFMAAANVSPAAVVAEAGGKGFWMPEAASDYAQHVDALFTFIMALSVFFFVMLMWLTAQFAWKYRASPTNTRSSPMSHNFRLEFLWSAIPTVLLFKGGQVVKRFQGLTSEAVLSGAIDAIV